jgi:L-glutamine-phosphate cytidylyltransferase
MNNLIILAAGEGSRLRPYTNDVPKCMVNLMGKPLLERNINEWKKVDDFDVTIITGYKDEIILEKNYTCIKNKNFKSTNMVWSLFMALEKINSLKDKFIYISYGDVILAKDNIEKLMQSSEEMNIVIDKDWESLWSMRMTNYLSDVESLKYINGSIVEIGKKIKNINDVQGQYIGILKINRELLINELISFNAWVQGAIDEHESNHRKNLYLTDFIQNFINNGGKPKPVFINGGWLEVDSVEDLQAYEDNWNKDSIFHAIVD